MNLFDNKDFDNHEQIVYCNDHRTSLKAIIAIHDTRLGPALGGCRMYPYANEEDALTDVLRLSKGMTYKSAISGLNFGGGKSVIIGDPAKLGKETLFRIFGRFIDGLNGRYITAEDVNTTPQYMEWIRTETKHVTGIPNYLGGLGDPSPITAHGTVAGIKAALKKLKGNDSLSGVKIAVEGVGHVGYPLCKELHENGAKLYATDVNETALKSAIKNFEAIAVKTDEIHGLDVDVFCPCALGATINDKTIPLLKCPIIAGSANNQLDDEEKHSMELKKRGILYAPDYVINAGGLMYVAAEYSRAGKELATAKSEEIYNTLLKIFHLAEEENTAPIKIANKLAEERIEDVIQSRHIYVPRGESRK